MAAGYACTELDLGYPEVRDSATVNNRPDQDGVDDRTKYAGGRAMSATIRAVGGAMKVDEIGALFAVFQIPNARPQLHYVLDRPGAPERFTTVRATGYAWPISGARTREINLGWLASDPFMYDPAERVATSLAGSSTTPGRTYNLTFPRIYPIGGGVPTTGEIRSPGEITVRPLLRIFGPVTNPIVEMTPTTGADPAGPPALIRFVAGFIIPAGSWVDVDTNGKTAFLNSDNAQSVMAQIDWAASVWPVLPTLPYWTWLTLRGDSTSAVSQVQALWYDGFLT
jgi:hypothetical protein